ncbi:unnamed protein product [Brassica rapa]|nr:unnamed protein product [Brassica rapa]
MTGAASNQPSKWTSELFDCMNDGENALITYVSSRSSHSDRLRRLSMKAQA